MPDAATQAAFAEQVAAHVAALDVIDSRQTEILAQLDELNERILRVLAANGVAPPKLTETRPPALKIPPPLPAEDRPSRRAAA